MAVPEESRSPGQKAASSRRREEISQHTQVLDLAQKHYLAQLRDSPAAIRYLKERGLTGLVAKEFGLGWASDDRQALSKVFPRYDDPLLVESGLVIESEDGRRYDRFRERVMFPIRNVKGEIVGFGGRIIGKGEPKYLNSPETPVFSKGNELYGLYEARSAIRSEGCVIVVEGYMDVVGLAQLGVRNAVATLGTATTPVHIQKLLRASDKIIFSLMGMVPGVGQPGEPCRHLSLCCAMIFLSGFYFSLRSMIPIVISGNSGRRLFALAWQSRMRFLHFFERVVGAPFHRGARGEVGACA